MYGLLLKALFREVLHKMLQSTEYFIKKVYDEFPANFKIKKSDIEGLRSTIIKRALGNVKHYADKSLLEVIMPFVDAISSSEPTFYPDDNLLEDIDSTEIENLELSEDQPDDKIMD